MKKKITLKADIEKKDFTKEEIKQDILLLEKKFSIPGQKEDVSESHKKENDNKPILKKGKAFLLKKEFKVIENKVYQKDNIFNLKKNTSKLTASQKSF